MITNLRSAFFLMLSLTFFIVILGVPALGTVMRPVRWSERARSAS